LVDLSVEEISGLARKYLAGVADEASVQKLSAALADDPQAALELLTQMQEALDQASPGGLSPMQWKDVDQNILAHIRTITLGKGGFFSRLLGRWFKIKPKPQAPAALPVVPAEPEAAPASLPSLDDLMANKTEGTSGLVYDGAGPETAAPLPRPWKRPLALAGGVLVAVVLMAGLGWLGARSLGLLGPSVKPASKPAAPAQAAAPATAATALGGSAPPPMAQSAQAPQALPAPRAAKMGMPVRALPKATGAEDLPFVLPSMTPMPAGRTDLESQP
jgi:pyruvate/2-oxoglutarate dehydrogenase complex dihydrolipoamide acyltransferase (E2) component